jgi:hypothetical protein
VFVVIREESTIRKTFGVSALFVSIQLSIQAITSLYISTEENQKNQRIMIFSLFEIHLDSLTHINSGHKNQKESLTQSYGQGRDSGGIESKVESYRVFISM